MWQLISHFNWEEFATSLKLLCLWEDRYAPTLIYVDMSVASKHKIRTLLSSLQKMEGTHSFLTLTLKLKSQLNSIVLKISSPKQSPRSPFWWISLLLQITDMNFWTSTWSQYHSVFTICHCVGQSRIRPTYQVAVRKITELGYHNHYQIVYSVLLASVQKVGLSSVQTWHHQML